jgi:hypothetical protein
MRTGGNKSQRGIGIRRRVEEVLSYIVKVGALVGGKLHSSGWKPVSEGVQKLGLAACFGKSSYTRFGCDISNMMFHCLTSVRSLQSL